MTNEEAIASLEGLIVSLANEGELPRGLSNIALRPDMELSDLGLDSLGKMNLLCGLDERLGLYIADDALPDHTAIGHIAELLVGLSNDD